MRAPLIAACAAVVCVGASTADAEQSYLVAGADSILRYSLEGDYLGELVSPGTTLTTASQFAVSPDGGTLYVGTYQAGSNVSIFDARTGAYRGNLDDGGPLRAPSVISFSKGGSLLVSDFLGGEVYAYDPQTQQRIGAFFTGGNLVNPHEVLQVDGGYLVSDYGRSRVNRYNDDGTFDSVFLQAGAATQLSRPLDMLISDDGGELFVSNNASGRVTVYDTQTGDLLRTIGAGNLRFPEGLAWAPDGSLIVANAGQGTVRRFDAQTGALLDTFEQVPGLTQGLTDVLLVPAPSSAAAFALPALLLARRRR